MYSEIYSLRHNLLIPFLVVPFSSTRHSFIKIKYIS